MIAAFWLHRVAFSRIILDKIVRKCFFFPLNLEVSKESSIFAAVFRGVAQLVAFLVWDQAVARSSRVAPTEIQNLKEKSLITNFTIGSQRLLLLLFSIA